VADDEQLGQGSRVGTVLDGAFKLTRLIFEGGMGTVFEAQQLHLDRRVAVKIMVRELTDNPEALARFRREVKITSQLAHPNVVQLLDFGTTPFDEPYLVMEFLDGEDLEHRLLRVERMPLESTVDVIRQVASALAAVHAKGIVHRDLKPANVFLLPLDGSSDFVKMVDFGVSKVRSSETKLTKSFTMLGTPEYMSPEQAEARTDDVDHRSDQWALACMAWRMLAGRSPFGGEHLNQVLEAIVHKDPPPLPVAELHLPPEIEPVLRRALSKRQSGRYATITAFARALETAAAGRRVSGGAAAAPAHAPAAALSAPGAGDLRAPPTGPSEELRPAQSGRGWLLVLLVLAAAGAAAFVYREPLLRLLG
jgi:serine/threonine protein kinase